MMILLKVQTLNFDVVEVLTTILYDFTVSVLSKVERFAEIIVLTVRSSLVVHENSNFICTHHRQMDVPNTIILLTNTISNIAQKIT